MKPNKFTLGNAVNTTKTPLRYFHYTPENRIKEIIASGEINLAYPSVKSSTEKACAWVSTNSNWEHTATKGRKDKGGNHEQLTFQEHKDWLGCARIEVKPIGIHSWNELKSLANMSSQWVRQMESAGIAMGGKPSEWFGSLEPIKSQNWVNIEVLKEGKWIQYNPDNDRAKEQGLTFVSVILPAPNEGQMALLIYQQHELQKLADSHNENVRNGLVGGGSYYAMWQESDIYQDIDINPHRLQGVLTKEQYDSLVKPKYDELEAHRKKAK